MRVIVPIGRSLHIFTVIKYMECSLAVSLSHIPHMTIML